METLLQDIRYAARKLVRAPGFTVIAVTTLALAIGATTSIFSVVNAVILTPMPFRNPDEVAFISSTNRDGNINAMSVLDFKDYRAQSKSFVGFAPLDFATMNLTHSTSEPVRIQAAQVGAQFFQILGVNAQIGRTFVQGEDERNAPRVVVLTDRMWRNRYGADRNIVGQTIRLDGDAYTVVGIAPASLNYPARSELFVPFVFADWQIDPANRGAHSIYAIARMKPGIPVAQGKRELQEIAKRLAVQYAESNTNFSGSAVPLQERITGNVKTPLYVMFGAVAFVLLIACANVANLLLVRASQREAEIAVRTALGAARVRIIRQLVTESLMLSLAGAAVGVALAAWAVAAVVSFGPEGLPRLQEVAVNTPVLLFALAVSAATGILFGLVPALHAARPDIAQMLRESVRGTTRGRAQRTRSILVMTEMTLAVVLLIGAGLLIHSFVRLLNVNPGFNPERVVTFNLSLPSTKYKAERQVRTLATDLQQRIAELPGARAVGITFGRPLDNSGLIRTTFEVKGWTPSTPQDRHVTQVHTTSPGYFAAMGISLVRGRLFTEAENRHDVPGAVVVSEEFVKRYFPNEDPIGRVVTYGIGHDTSETGNDGPVTVAGAIVGVVKDVKAQDLSQPNYPTSYVAFNQFPIGFFSVMIRTEADPRAMQAAIKKVVRDVDADLPIFGLKTMEQAVSDSVAQPRFYMVLLAAFAGIALLLAAIGIYGVISYSVSQRTRELGIRVALGATRQKIVALVVGQGLWIAAVGVGIGIAASLALTKAMASLLFGIDKLDPLTFAAAPLVLMVAAALGCYLPARRAASADPVVAMRND
ncbi:MAG TPA: ABC transporter permease [Gemmatimonadaceae bacterium]|nr:ABC transporter permease [Gemmatimonadaceae bacterium]